MARKEKRGPLSAAQVVWRISGPRTWLGYVVFLVMETSFSSPKKVGCSTSKWPWFHGFVTMGPRVPSLLTSPEKPGAENGMIVSSKPWEKLEEKRSTIRCTMVYLLTFERHKKSMFFANHPKDSGVQIAESSNLFQNARDLS